MSMQNLEELFVDKLKDIYDAERRITRALPKMAKAASSEELASAFEEHLQQTHGQIERLDQIFESLGKTPGRKMCHGMMGLIEEGAEIMEKDGAEAVKDAALIAAAQGVEHYEISSYGCLKTWAQLLGKVEEIRLLDESLKEEEETDEKLTALAFIINRQAMEGREGEENEEEDVEMVGAGRRSDSAGRSSTSGSKRSEGSRGSGASQSSGGSRGMPGKRPR